MRKEEKTGHESGGKWLGKKTELGKGMIWDLGDGGRAGNVQHLESR